MKCERDHEAIKLDAASWSALPLRGVMPAYDDERPSAKLELRNCDRCHSTLAKEIP